MSWQPIIDINSDKGQRISNKINEIAIVLLNRKNTEINNPGLMGGKIGIALFLFYYAKLIDNQKPYDAAFDLLSSTFDDINKGYSYHTHAGGLAGIGTSIGILKKADFIDIDTNDILQDIDDYLHQLMIAEIQKGNYDFLHGAIGIGLYFLKRFPNNNSEKYISDLITELDNIAHKDNEGTKWLSILNIEIKNEGYNLSLSHGLASIIVFLSKVHNIGIAKEKTEKLLFGAIKYLLNNRLDTSLFGSNFPSWICKGEKPAASRLAWCYGDLGIGIALWLAGENTNNNEWKNKAIDVLLHASNRKDLLQNSVLDAGFCHGSAGIAHIFNRIYQYSGNIQFKESGIYWMEESLKFGSIKDGLAGYKTFRMKEHGGPINEPGFLEGIAGIGLTLISSVSTIEPNWDESLFLS